MPAQRRNRTNRSKAIETPKEWDRRLLEDQGLTYDYLKLDDINVDTAYQRPLRAAKIDKMVSEFNPAELTAIVVSKREDGEFYVLDGQHRLEALRRLGKRVVLADIRTGLNLEQEAYLFYRLNEGQTHVSAWDKFKARLTANEIHAVAIRKIVEQNGLFIGRVSEGGIQAVGGLEAAYNMGRLNKTMQVISTVWQHDRTARESQIIMGLAQFLLTFDALERFDEGRLVEVLDTIAPSLLLRRAKEIAIETGRSGQRASTVSIAIRDAYNGEMTRGNRPDRGKRLTGIPIVQWTRYQHQGGLPG